MFSRGAHILMLKAREELRTRLRHRPANNKPGLRSSEWTLTARRAARVVEEVSRVQARVGEESVELPVILISSIPRYRIHLRPEVAPQLRIPQQRRKRNLFDRFD